MMDDEREREFDECEATQWGWDGYHVEDAVGFARMFRRQRDEARAELARVPAEREALQKTVDSWAGLVAAHTYSPPLPPATLTVSQGQRCQVCGGEIWTDLQGLPHDAYSSTPHRCGGRTYIPERAP